MGERGPIDDAQDALDRMHKAYQGGVGVYLTRKMIDGLALTIIGEMWAEERPQLAALAQEQKHG